MHHVDNRERFNIHMATATDMDFEFRVLLNAVAEHTLRYGIWSDYQLAKSLSCGVDTD
jgi:hypothetical protein